MPRTDFGAHAWWRVFGSEAGFGANYVAYSAMAFKDETGSTITVSGGSTIESGHFGSFPVANLFDGTNSTFWESTNAVIPYAGYHFGSAVKVMQIGLQKAGSMDGSTPAALAWLQFSDDGVTWCTVGQASPNALSAADTMFWFNFAGGL
jgi:F5/8 type C domain